MTDAFGQLTRTKLFQQHILSRRDAEDGAWSTYEEGPTIDEQVQEWVDATGNAIVSVSPPGYAMGWLDEEMITRSILIGVVVIYRPALESNRDQRRATGGAPAKPTTAGAAGSPRTATPQPNIAAFKFTTE